MIGLLSLRKKPGLAGKQNSMHGSPAWRED